MANIVFALGLVILAAGWLVPGHYQPWSSAYQQWVSAFGVALLGAAALIPRSAKAQVPRVAVISALLAIVPMIQWGVGQVRFLSDAVLPSLYLVGFALAVVFGSMLTLERRQEWIGGLTASIVAAAVISVAIAMTQWLDLDPVSFTERLERGGRPFANLGQPNHLATLLAMGIVGALRSHQRRQLGGATAGVVLAWLGFGMVMTQSRTGWLFVAAVSVWYLASIRRSNLRLTSTTVVIMATLFAFAVMAWAPLNDWMQISHDSLAERVRPGTRLLHWAALWDAAQRAPWLGYGWSQVTLAQQAVILDHPASHESLSNSHNIVLDLMLWMGIPAALLLTSAALVWLANRVRACRDPDQWALIAMLGAVLLHALLEYPLNYAYFLLPLGLLIGSLDAQDPRAGPSLPRWVAILSLALSTALLGWIGREYLVVESSVRQLRLSMMGLGPRGAEGVAPPDVILLDAPREYHRFWQVAARPGMSVKELDWMRDVSQHYAFPPAMLRYALAAGLNGREDEARRTLARLCKLHVEERCAEGRQSWAKLQQRYPQLVAIELPY